MERRFQLTQLVQAVESNLPSGTIILDTTGNVSTFYKYKGTLVERDSSEFNEATLRSRIKHSLTRGSTLAIRLHPQDDISEFLTPSSINPIIMNRSKITQGYLDSLSEGRDDLVLLDQDYIFTVIINGTQIPACLQPFVNAGDLVPITIV
jgi:hypothetical protein